MTDSAVPRPLLDAHAEMAKLAQARPVFHSEADFQLALALQLAVERPDLDVRLETRPFDGVHLDMQIAEPSTGRCSAVELKYLTRRWDGKAHGEEFRLKKHSAANLRSYDAIRDIVRVERCVETPGWDGWVIVLTNDPAYGRTVPDGRAANFDAFRLSEGRTLTGALAWREPARLMPERVGALVVRGRYDLRWRQYSAVDGNPSTELRYAALHIGALDA